MRRLLYLLLTLVVLAALALLALATPPGRAVVAGMIERGASGNGLTVSVGSLSGWPPFWLSADKIIVSDADGVFAEGDNVSINVNITALITGNISVDSIAADRVSVQRRPNLPHGESGGVLLPFAAKEVAVARLELGEALVARAAVLSLNGSFVAGIDGSVAARLDAQRTDGRVGTLTAAIDRANLSAPFAIDIQLSEDADGVIVGLMGRRTGPGFTLAAKTAIKGEQVDGSLSLASNGAAHFSGTFALSPASETGEHLVLKGDGDLAELVPPEYADLLSGPINVAVDADWSRVADQPLPRISIRQGTVTTANVRAEASGSLAEAAANLALTINARKADGSTIMLPFTSPPSQVNTISLTGKVTPTAEAMRLELVGQIAGLQGGAVTIPGLGLSLAVEAKRDDPLAGGALPFALRVEADAVQTATGRIESVGGAPLILTADGTFDTATATAETSAKLAAAGGTVTFAGALSATSANGKTTADFADLRPLSPLAGRPISGGLNVAAEGTLFGPETNLKVDALATNLNTGDATVARLLAGETRLAATIVRRANGSTAISDLSLTGDALTANGGVTITAEAIDGTLDGGISDLSRLAEASSGAATFVARISGSPTRPTIDTTITVASGKLLNQPVENAGIHLQGAPANAGWLAALTLEGAFGGKPLAGKAGASYDAAGQFAFPDIDLTIGDNRITGAIERTAEGPLSGTLTVDAPNVQTLAALGLINATGSGEAKLQFAPDGARQSVAVSFTGSNFTYQTIAAGTIEGEIHIDDAFGTPLVRGNATASAMTIGTIRLDTAQATATITGGATRFDATAKGPDVNLTGSGSLNGTAGAQVVRLDTLLGSAFGLPVALAQPVTINFDGARSGIAGASLALGGGRVLVNGTISPTLNLVVTAERVSAAVVNGFAPQLGAEGTISGRATITGTTAAPATAWTLDWSGLKTAATSTAGLPGLSLSARGNANGKATSISGRVGGAGLALDLSGQVPFSGPGLAVKATGTAPLALLALQSNRELRLAGSARVNLALSGLLAAVATNGTIDLADATIADTDTGFGIAGATGRIAFDGRRATTSGISGRLAQGGNVTVSGSLAIDSAGLPANLAIKVVNGRYADGTMVYALFSADLAINGPLLGNGTVSGRIDLGRTEIQLPDRIGGSATAIDVKHRNAPRGFKPPKPRQAARSGGAEMSGQLRLDIALNGNSAIFVRGFGIDAELGGSLRLTGTTGNPQTAGAFTQRRGRIEMLGRRFTFQSGTLTFAGDLVPVVDFAATTQTSDGTVTLHVTGPANDPRISFTSSSGLPEEEVLSRLLFDRGVGSLSPLQAAQLVDAVAQMTGALGGTGLFSRVRQATGLDDLDIRQSATGGTTVGLAKRINDNVRLGVEAGTDPGSGRVVIDLDLTKNLKARGEAGEGGEGKVGLTFEREY